MRKCLALLAIIGLLAAPSVAQTSQSQPAPPSVAQTSQSQPAPVAKEKTVTKVVCERVNVETETGSRLGSTPKVCKKVVVPVTDKTAQQPQAQGHSGHAH